MASTPPPENSANIVHVEGGSKHFARPVPPIRVAAQFSNPINDEESDNETVSTVETPPPPDIIDAPTGKQLDAFRLLLQNTFNTTTHERHCAGLPLPKELLQNVDISWILRGTTSGNTPIKSGGVSPAVPSLPSVTSPNKSPGNHSHKGKRSLDSIMKHRKEKILIDSPRSVMVLMKAGTNASSLKFAPDDAITESRIKKSIAVLQKEYRQLALELSQHCVIHYLNTGTKKPGVPVRRPLGYIAPSAKAQLSPVRGGVDSSPDSSPEHKRPNAMRVSALASRAHEDEESDSSLDLALVVKQNRVGEKIPAFALLEQRRKQLRSPSNTGAGTPSPSRTGIKRAKPRNLQRLLQHRDLLTAGWGIRQQTLVSDAYQSDRLDELMEKRKQAKAAPSPTAVVAIKEASLRSATVPLVYSSPVPEGDTRSQNSGHSGVTGVKGQREISVDEKLRRKEHIAAKRRQQKALEETRRNELDGMLKRKGKLAEEAAERRHQRRKDLMEIQTAKEKKVQEVNERMKRTEAYKSLQLVQRMEDEAERAVARENLVAQEKKALQEEHRQRNLLEYETRQFIQKSTVKMDKMMCQQQTMARRVGDVHLKSTAERSGNQRKLKEESRELLKHVLKNEDKLIAHWKVLDELDH